MESDDDRLDDEPASALLPPEDRLWRHPSETAVSSFGWNPSASRDGLTAGTPRLVTVAVLASSITALLTLGAVLAVLPQPRSSTFDEVGPTVARTANVAGVADMAAIVGRVLPSIVRLEVDGGDGLVRGSGVVVSADGMLVTNYHVVAGARSIRVLVHDGRMLSGRLLGVDPETDIAVVDVEGENFQAATFGTVTGLHIGEPAITMGAPTGLGSGPVSMGVVSALGQQVDSGGTRLVDMIETDAPLGPGCSGGALLDQTGAVVGIATTNATTPAGVLGYATPIDVARSVVDQLAATGSVRRVWLGIEGEDLEPTRAQQLGLQGAAVVMGVKPASPAADAGLAPADLITSIEGQTVRSMAALMVAVRSRSPGDVVTLSVLRDGKPTVVQATLAGRPPPAD